MKDSELQIDRSCHVLYSKPCKKEILAKITLHYPEVEREAVWEQVQLRYAELLSKWRTDLGGKKNFHNGAAEITIVLLCSVIMWCAKKKHLLRKSRRWGGNLFLPAFKNVKFVDCNKPIYKKLMYWSFALSNCGFCKGT